MPKNGRYVPRIGQLLVFTIFVAKKKTMRPLPDFLAAHTRLYPDFIADADELFRSIQQTTEWDTRMQARRTASFGVAYNYSGMAYPQTDMPENLQAICGCINETLGFLPNNCLLNEYGDGNASMGYHSDQTDDLEDDTGIVIVSLGSTRELRFKNKADKTCLFAVPLEPGSLFYMDQAVQAEWLHAIPATGEAGPRISLTFRKMKTG